MAVDRRRAAREYMDAARFHLGPTRIPAIRSRRSPGRCWPWDRHALALLNRLQPGTGELFLAFDIGLHRETLPRL